jgi:L-threonylcarbamoyladenylate synthase
MAMNYRALRKYLQHGGLIAYPTESCFGLGCDPGNRSAVKRLLRLKKRPQAKGLILIACDLRQLRPYIGRLSAGQQEKVNATWPGPHTWLIPTSANCPVWLTGKHPSIAVRLTAHEPARRLCQGVDMALVSTSANKSGAKPAKTWRECRRLFGDQVKVLPGRIGTRRRPSTIQDLATGRIIRR